MQGSDGFRTVFSNAKKYLIPALVCLIGVLLIAFIFLLRLSASRNKYFLEMQMSGPDRIELAQGESYTEMGATARYYETFKSGQDVIVPVRISGTVDTDKYRYTKCSTF